MGNIVKTAKCRFCGQMTQIEADENLTAAQAEKQRKEKAMMNVSDFILSIYKDITKIIHYSPGGKVLDCKYKKIK